jgi:hypothetical protein
MIDTEQLQATLQRDLDALERAHQELRLQMKLASADLKSEWSRLEQRLLLAREEIGRVHAHAKLHVDKIERESRELLGQLRRDYEHLRECL